MAIKNQPHVPKTINKSKNIPKQEKAKKQIQMKIGFLNFFFCFIYIRFLNLTMIGEPPEQKEAKQNNNWNGMEDPLARRPGQKNLLLLLGIEMKMVNRKISHVIHLFWWTLLHLYWLLLAHVDDAVLITSMCSR